MKEKNLEEISRNIMDLAIKRGIRDVKVNAFRQQVTKALYRTGELDKLEGTSIRHITLALFDQGKYGSCTLNDFDPEAIETFLDNAVVMTRAMEPDPYREITDPELYRDRSSRDLDLYNAELAAFPVDRIKELARETEEAARFEAGEQAVSTEGGMEVKEFYSFRIHSNGMEGEYRSADAWIYGSASLKDKDGKRPGDGSCGGSRTLKELKTASETGRESVERAMMRLGAVKAETCKSVMILENRVAGHLLKDLFIAMCGRAIQQKNSFLSLNDRDNSIGSSLLTLTDDPFIPRGWGSRWFDSDGISSKPFPLVQEGRLKNFLIDYYYSKKLQENPTTGWFSNLLVGTGQNSLEDLIRNTEQGILVRNFLGGNCNGTTGDFSYGITGTKIEHGKLAFPVTEMNISGNHRELWHKLSAAGNDVWPYADILSPSLMFRDIQFSGN